MKNSKDTSRRSFLQQIGIVGIGLPLLSAKGFQLALSPEEIFMKNKQSGKMGIALVGLGGYATHQLAPALQKTTGCYLAGIVTGTPSKIPIWQEKYGIPAKNCYSYTDFDKIKDNPSIDVVYIVLPNNMHAEYTIRAAAAGKHVICEKPMAITVEDCDKMIAACKKANVLLSIGYRLHFDPYNKEMMRCGAQKIYGSIQKLSGGFGFKATPNQWRLTQKYAGGGPLMDVGIYVIQAMCYTAGMNPIAVSAQEGTKTDMERFKEVEQSLTWQFEFPGGLIGRGETSYNDNMNYIRAEAEKGVFELTSAYNYGGQKGSTPAGAMSFTHVNQQALQMDAFAVAVQNKQASIVPGEMGRRDVVYLQAIYEAMRTGKKIQLPKI